MYTRYEDWWRLQRLHVEIDILYEDLDPNLVDELERAGHPIVTEMMEVTEIHGKETIALSSLYVDEHFYPVKAPDTLVRHLCLHDVFLMTLEKKRTHWEIVQMSHPYVEEKVDEMDSDLDDDDLSDVRH